MNICQCASIRPGISTRPFASITRTSAPASVAVGLADIRSMMLLLTSTLEGADSAAFLPSKMRTFRKSVAPAVGKAGAASSGPSSSASYCARPGWHSPARNAAASSGGNSIRRKSRTIGANEPIKRFLEFIVHAPSWKARDPSHHLTIRSHSRTADAGTRSVSSPSPPGQRQPHSFRDEAVKRRTDTPRNTAPVGVVH